MTMTMTMVLFGVINMFLYHHSFADQRRQLHQPFFPMDSLPPAMTPQPQSQSQSQRQLPFSTAPSSFFFPSYRSPSPPSPTALTSFPANISSLLLPRAHSNSHRHVIAVAVSASLLSAALLVSLAALFLFFFRRRRHNSASRSDSLRLFPPQSATRSSEFLYLGTLVNSAATSKIGGLSSSPYHKLGSPELNPLPPLPKNNLYNDDEEFFSPRGSGDKRSFGSTTPSYPSPVMPPPPRPLPTPVSSSSSSSSPSSLPTSSSLSEAAGPTPPPAPPPPPALPPSDNNNSDAKPKLKPLHWDKVRASSDRAMVWDHFKSSSFQLNEEMIESLFVANNSNTRRVLGSKNQNLVLDPKKSQNIAILLRALNVTVDEVCQGLLEGNSDTLGPELLESLLKMAPTKEEEWKLREYKDGSLGPADKFLKAVLEIPFAFKRVEALLYIANFDSEIDYLARSFATLEVACGELKNSRMLMKILEAVLKTGNRMNIGTNRGAAHAFKLDTLLKLVDVRGADGKTTLLHFVVQEIMRAEGLRLCVATKSETHHQSSSYWDDVEFRKLGLQVVSGLSGELSNVKKAATMDSDVLANEVAKLAGGIAKVAQVLKSNEQVPLKFSESMNGFLKKAEQEIGKLQAQERAALSLVREVTEYFHGNSGKEEAHRFRIFMVVRDFLSALDHVCKQVGKFNDRSRVGFRQFANPSFPGLDGRQII